MRCQPIVLDLLSCTSIHLPKILIQFFIIDLYLLFGNPQFLHNEFTFWAILSCFHPKTKYHHHLSKHYEIIKFIH